jgi:hypothetical protein
MRKVKIIEKKTSISKEALRLARHLHREEHFAINGKIESNHKLEDWYYLMACELIVGLRNEIKEILKQQKYLWQTLEEVIENLKSLKGTGVGEK